MVRNFVPSADKIYQWEFPKVSALKRSTKGRMTGYFRSAHQQKVSKNEIRKQFRVSADETYE